MQDEHSGVIYPERTYGSTTLDATFTPPFLVL